MRKSLLGLLGAAFLAALPLGSALAQVSPNQTTQTGTRLDACTQTAVGTNFNTVNTQSTATIVVPAGLYAYICKIELEAMQDATGNAMTNLSFTSTGLGSGAANSPQWAVSQPLTVNGAYSRDIVYATPLKSATSGTNVTVVSPAAQTHVGFGIKIVYYLAQ